MNKKGVALILSYMVIMVLTVLGTAFVARSVSENSIAKRYADSERAFWVAEAGLAQAYYNALNNIAQPGASVSFGGGAYSVNTADPSRIAVTGTFGNSSRAVQLSCAFKNTLSVGGNLTLQGFLARAEVYGSTRISGAYSQTGGATAWFQDKQEGVPASQTTIAIPDYNHNGTGNEFGDFVLFGQAAAQSYPADQVVYIQNNGTVNIFPNQSLVGKKIVYVEGSSPGTGNVNIFFDATWQDNQDLTIIATGKITYVEPLQYQANSRLSAISWGDYNEASIFRSQHESVIYTHNNANFVDILEWGSTTGNIIANHDISLREVLTYEKYYYSDDPLAPGFSSLGSAASNLTEPKTGTWQEVSP